MDRKKMIKYHKISDNFTMKNSEDNIKKLRDISNIVMATFRDKKYNHIARKIIRFVYENNLEIDYKHTNRAIFYSEDKKYSIVPCTKEYFNKLKNPKELEAKAIFDYFIETKRFDDLLFEKYNKDFIYYNNKFIITDEEIIVNKPDIYDLCDNYFSKGLEIKKIGDNSIMFMYNNNYIYKFFNCPNYLISNVKLFRETEFYFDNTCLFFANNELYYFNGKNVATINKSDYATILKNKINKYQIVDIKEIFEECSTKEKILPIKFKIESDIDKIIYSTKQTFQIDEYDPNELMICAILLGKCNYDCFYCCSGKSKTYKTTLFNDDGKQDELSKDQIDFILEKMKDVKYNITFNVLGGEPMIAKNIKYLCDRAEHIPTIKKVEISTNGTIEINFKTPKLYVIFTYHPSEVKSDKKIIHNIGICMREHIPFDVNVMIPQDNKYNAKIEQFIKKLKLLKINPIAVYPFQEGFTQIGKRFAWEDQKCYNHNGTYYCLYDVYNKNLNRFKGWTCYNMCYIINLNGDIQQCSDKILGNIYHGFDFNHPVLKCPYETCNYEGFLRSYKELND